MKKDDVFAKAPEFLAAFNNIVRNGFFGSMDFNCSDLDAGGDVHHCNVIATGYVPSDNKYQKEGVGAMINPKAIIASCKKISSSRKVRKIDVTVTTTDWPLYDRTESKIIGSKGTTTEMSIHIRFVV